MENIYWKDVKDSDIVEIKGNPGSQYYVVNGTHVANWCSRTAIAAQAKLNHLARKNISFQK